MVLEEHHERVINIFAFGDEQMGLNAWFNINRLPSFGFGLDDLLFDEMGIGENKGVVDLLQEGVLSCGEISSELLQEESAALQILSI